MKIPHVIFAALLVLCGCNTGLTLDEQLAYDVSEGNHMYRLQQSAQYGFKSWLKTYRPGPEGFKACFSYPEGARMRFILISPKQRVIFECTTDTVDFKVSDTSHAKRALTTQENKLLVMYNTTHAMADQLPGVNFHKQNTVIFPYDHPVYGQRCVIISEKLYTDTLLWGGDYLCTFARYDSIPVTENVHPFTENPARADSTIHRHEHQPFSPIDYLKLRLYRPLATWKTHRIQCYPYPVNFRIDMPTLSISHKSRFLYK